MPIPPHLPPPVCNVEHYHKWQRIKLLAAAAFFGVVAGLSGAAMMIGWVWPGFGGGNNWITSQSVIKDRSQLSDSLRHEIEEKIATVYSQENTAGAVGFLAVKNRIGQAVVVTSDGWMVMQKPSQLNFKTWRLLFSDGSVYGVTKVFADNRSEILLLKVGALPGGKSLSNVQFKVTSFAPKVKVNDDDFIFSNNRWQWAYIQEAVAKNLVLPHLDTAPTDTFLTSGSFVPGSLSFNNDGQLQGVVRSDGLLLPSFYIDLLSNRFLAAQEQFKYSSLGVEGWFSTEQPLLIKDQAVVGFYVNRILATDNLLRVGDIVRKINGQIVDQTNLWYTVYNTPIGDMVKLQILRGEKELNVDVKIVEVKG